PVLQGEQRVKVRRVQMIHRRRKAQHRHRGTGPATDAFLRLRIHGLTSSMTRSPNSASCPRVVRRRPTTISCSTVPATRRGRRPTTRSAATTTHSPSSATPRSDRNSRPAPYHKYRSSTKTRPTGGASTRSKLCTGVLSAEWVYLYHTSSPARTGTDHSSDPVSRWTTTTRQASSVPTASGSSSTPAAAHGDAGHGT